MFSIFITLLVITAAMANTNNQDVKPLKVISNDSYNDRQITHDISSEFKPESNGRLFGKSTLFSPGEPPNPSAYTAVRASIPKNSPSLHNVALLEVLEEFAPGFVYMIRFVEINPSRPNSGIVSSGISSTDHYASQWGAKGIFLGSQGNLYSQGLLENGFIDNYKPGMFIDWFVEVKVDSLDIFIAMGGESRGHAYHVDLTAPKDCFDVVKKLRPIVGFSEDSDQAEILVINFHPVKISLDKDIKYRTVGKEIPSDENDPLNISGKWRIIDSSIEIKSQDSKLVEQEQNWVAVGIKWDAQTNLYSIAIKCMNSMMAKLKVLDAETGKVSGGPVLSTMMLPPPEIMKIETYVSDVLESIEEIEHIDWSYLSLISSKAKTPLRLVRFTAPRERKPQEINPFCALMI